jgi:hypothetical protein
VYLHPELPDKGQPSAARNACAPQMPPRAPLRMPQARGGRQAAVATGDAVAFGGRPPPSSPPRASWVAAQPRAGPPSTAPCAFDRTIATVGLATGKALGGRGRRAGAHREGRRRGCTGRRHGGRAPRDDTAAALLLQQQCAQQQQHSYCRPPQRAASVALLSRRRRGSGGGGQRRRRGGGGGRWAREVPLGARAAVLARRGVPRRAALLGRPRWRDAHRPCAAAAPDVHQRRRAAAPGPWWPVARAVRLLNISGEGGDARGFAGSVLELGPGEAVLQVLAHQLEPASQRT